MSTRYADIIDRAEIVEIIGTKYQNEAKMVSSGLVTFEGDIMQGTTEEWIKESLFEGDTAGQVIGVNSEISLKSKTQTLYKMPVCFRADGAELDDIEGEITPKVRRAAEATVVSGISRKAAQMVDEVFVSIINGMGLYQVGAAENYLDKNGSQVSPKILQQGKAKRSDEGAFQNGIILCRGLMWHQLYALGAVAYTSNTLGQAKQDQIINSGVLGTLLGMSILADDKIHNYGGTATDDGTDHYIYLMDRGAIIGKNGGTPDVDPIQRKERSFKDVIKFKIKVGGTVRGMSWNTSSSDKITNTNLATAASWTRAADYAKYVPVVTIRVDEPTFA